MKKNNKNYLERYSRQIVLKNIGMAGQKKINISKVFIVGAGGLGCPIADLLCRAGVGEIGIIDHDKVSLSNLNRQTLFTPSDIGKFKVSQAKIKISKIKTISYDDPKLNEKIRSFYFDNKRVRNLKIKKILDWTPKYRNYKLGLKRILEI